MADVCEMSGKVLKKGVAITHEHIGSYSRDGKDIVKCLICGKEYVKNITRMVKHVTNCGELQKRMQNMTSNDMEIDEKNFSSDMLINNSIEVCLDEMQSSDIAAKHFILDQNNRYKCIYCDSSYVRHVTKMCQHIGKCKKAPRQITEMADKVMNVLENKRRRINSLKPQKDKEYSNDAVVLGNLNFSTNVFENREQKIDKDFLWRLYARAIISARVPLNSLDNIHWRELFRSWNPACPLPTNDDLMNGYIDEEFKSVKHNIEEEVLGSLTYGVQICNKNPAETVFYLNTSKCFLFKTLTNTENIFNDFEVFQTVKLILSDFHANKCMDIVCNFEMTNTEFYAVIKQYIQQEKLAISVYPYAADSLQNLLQEILHLPSFLSLNETLQSLFIYVDELQELKEEVYNYKKKILGNDLPLGLTDCLTRNEFDLIKIKKLFKLIVVSYSESFTPEIKEQVFNDTFWTEAIKLLELLEPIKSAISSIIENDTYLSDIVHLLSNIEKVFYESIQNVQITDQEKEESIQLLLKFRETMLTPAHFAANVLDPRYIGQDNSPDENQLAVEFLITIGKSLKLGDESQVLSPLGKYKLQEDQWRLKSLWDTSVTNPRLWWGTIFGENVLTKIANSIFLMNTKETKYQTNDKELDPAVQYKIDFIAFNTSKV